MHAYPRTVWTLLAGGCFVTLSAGSCAQGTVSTLSSSPGGQGTSTSTGESSGGSGGSGGASDGGTDAGDAGDAASDGPVACLHESDCIGVGDACNTGSCLNNVCVKMPANDGAGCDDGLFCTVDDTCSMGACMGVPKVCSVSDPCMTGTCDETDKTCTSMPGEDGTPCDLPDNACFIDAVCLTGVCTGETPVNCSFLDSPCGTGTCDPVQGCVSMPLNNGAPCTTNDFCTVNQTCQGGTCQGTAKVCPPSTVSCQVNVCNSAEEACVSSEAPDGTTCSTMDICLTGQTCTAGACGGGVPANQGTSCTNPNVCMTSSTCDNGACTGTPITACVGGDGCCPPGCTAAMDSDCNCSVDVALTAVGSVSDGGMDPDYGPDQLNNGIGVSQCNMFSWVLSESPNQYFELDWTAPVTVASIYVETVTPTTPSTCSSADPGRNVATADVDYWNGSAWVTSTSFTGQTGNVQINLPSPVNTTKLRLANVVAGNPSYNALIFEWHVFAAPGCIPPAD